MGCDFGTLFPDAIQNHNDAESLFSDEVLPVPSLINQANFDSWQINEDQNRPQMIARIEEERYEMPCEIMARPSDAHLGELRPYADFHRNALHINQL